MDFQQPSKEELKKVETFLRSLKLHDANKVNDVLYPVHDKVFSETDCLACANCCKTSPPILNQSDIKRISKHLGTSKKQFSRKYVIQDIDGTQSFNFVPCHFLNQDNRCQIYEIRPIACKEYPHTRQPGFEKRTNLNLKNAEICPATFQIIKRIEELIQKDL